MLEENQFDPERGIESSNQILPLVNCYIKKEEFSKAKVTLKRYFLERTASKNNFWKG